MIGGTGIVTGRTHSLAADSRAGTVFHRTSLLELAPLPSASSCARLHAVLVLYEWDLRKVAEDATLLVSELVTNAADASIVLPDRPPVALRLLASGHALIIEVWDQSPFDLEHRETNDEDECGRGLTVVAALSDRWGCQRTGYRRKVVWAELAL